MATAYPEMIENLPDADVPVEGVEAKLLPSEYGQVVFFKLPAGQRIPPHAHGAQWGVVLEGELELTIGEETVVYRKGDTYFIPAGVTHTARFRTDCRVLDVFAEPDRYAMKPE